MLWHPGGALHDDRRRGVKGARWLLPQNYDRLRTRADRVRRRELLRANRALFTVYVLKDDLKRLWRFRYPGAAWRFWREWRRRALASRLPALKKFVRLRAPSCRHHESARCCVAMSSLKLHRSFRTELTLARHGRRLRASLRK